MARLSDTKIADLLAANRRLCRWHAARYVRWADALGMSFDDLVSEATLGLFLALRRYDTTKTEQQNDRRIIAYASNGIRNHFSQILYWPQNYDMRTYPLDAIVKQEKSEEEKYLEREKIETLYSALDKLSPLQREVITRRHMCGERMTNMIPGGKHYHTVTEAYKIARKKLRYYLGVGA